MLHSKTYDWNIVLPLLEHGIEPSQQEQHLRTQRHQPCGRWPYSATGSCAAVIAAAAPAGCGGCDMACQEVRAPEGVRALDVLFQSWWGLKDDLDCGGNQCMNAVTSSNATHKILLPTLNTRDETCRLHTGWVKFD